MNELIIEIGLALDKYEEIMEATNNKNETLILNKEKLKIYNDYLNRLGYNNHNERIKKLGI